MSDPTAEEEILSSARLSVVTDGEIIFSVHKPGKFSVCAQYENGISHEKYALTFLFEILPTLFRWQHIVRVPVARLLSIS